MAYKPAFNHYRSFGIEIECIMPGGMMHTELARKLVEETGLEVVYEGYTHATRGHWKVVTDASLGRRTGAELVSPVLAGPAGLEQVAMMAAALDRIGCTVNRDCGLHVHHDVNDYHTKHMVNLGCLYTKLEGAIDRIMPPSRRTGNCMTNSLRYNGTEQHQIAAKMDHIRGARDMRDAIDRIARGRFHKLNPTAWHRAGTVEFRQHSGTVDAEKMVCWIKLTQSMVERAYQARQITAQGTDKLDIIIRFCPDRKTKKFYRDRYKHFAKLDGLI